MLATGQLLWSDFPTFKKIRSLNNFPIWQEQVSIDQENYSIWQENYPNRKGRLTVKNAATDRCSWSRRALGSQRWSNIAFILADFPFSADFVLACSAVCSVHTLLSVHTLFSVHTCAHLHRSIYGLQEQVQRVSMVGDWLRVHLGSVGH